MCVVPGPQGASQASLRVADSRYTQHTSPSVDLPLPCESHCNCCKCRPVWHAIAPARQRLKAGTHARCSEPLPSSSVTRTFTPTRFRCWGLGMCMHAPSPTSSRCTQPDGASSVQLAVAQTRHAQRSSTGDDITCMVSGQRMSSPGSVVITCGKKVTYHRDGYSKAKRFPEA